MVKATFKNLPKEKKDRVTAALLNEFGHHTLKDAQVARIVKDAGIARGAFYKYFNDLTDAYCYLFRIAIKGIHSDMSPTEKYDPQVFYDRVLSFLDKTSHSKYESLIKLHVTHNETDLPATYSNAQGLLNMSPELWSAMVLSHEVIGEVLSDPDDEKKELLRFKKSLEILKKGTD
ncbi:TetR/AcrR family transcriptional regulator [Lactobacillus acetotolerans]|uniref:TetR/AcrR family transcriptional regulator n=1 Tax=Lactobacillus acetotolerans TaxID=1600 RepID=UPI0007BA5F39|nr:TetR/AcrR family transcriptional regulator [Lactobacillus acetotolerans]QGV04024.1 TetR family transcriptional regulator [Lactobacillus acetotolerans]